MITILIPLFNGIEFIDECLESIKTQTYQDWKVIIGVNGYSKKSDVYLKAVDYQSDKIMVYDYHHLSNKVDTLLEMNKNVTTPYICLLDIDDKWHHDKLTQQLRYMEKYDIVGTFTRYFGNSKIIPKLPRDDLENFDFFTYNPIINSSVMLKKELLVYNFNNEIENIDRDSLEDYSLWLKLKSLNYKFFNIYNILTFHRIHSKSFYNNKSDQTNKINKIKEYYIHKYVLTNDITIVTSYYKLDNSKHSIENYKIWMRNFFQIKTPKIVFTNKSTYEEYFKTKHSDNTYYYILEWEEFYTWKYIDTFRNQHKIDHEKDKHNVYLYLLWNEKSSFLKKSIEKNIFSSEYFVYCDIGCFRMGRYMQYYYNWPNIKNLKSIGNKVTILNIEEFSKHEHIIDNNGLPKSFQYLNRIGGGIIAGNSETLNIWFKLYYEILEKFIKNNRFIGKDQSIMATLYILNPEIINLIKAKKTHFCQNNWFHLEPYLQGLSN